MRKLLLIILLFGGFTIANAQFVNYGIKGGISQNINGNIYLSNSSGWFFPSSGELGYHIGFFAEFKLPLWLYLRPELYYTHTESSYEFVDSEKSTLTLNKIDMPILVGARVLKYGRVFFGPAFHYNFNTDLSNTPSYNNLKKISSDDFAISGQIGLGLEFGKFGGDVRYEYGFTNNHASFERDFIDDFDPNKDILLETKHQQVIFSLYYKFK